MLYITRDELPMEYGVYGGCPLCPLYILLCALNALCSLTLGRTWGGGGGGKIFLSFSLEDKTSAPDVFSSCSFIPHADFETSLVMVSCYGYEI